MKTLAELKRENERLKNQIQAKREIEEIGRKRNKLLRENKALLMRHKYPGLHNFAVGSQRVGKSLGEGLVRWAKRVQEAEAREQRMKQRMKKRRTTRRKSTRRRRR